MVKTKQAVKITKKKMQAYEDIRTSGVTNMFAIDVVCSLSNLSREECFAIMKGYDKYMKQFKIKRG